MSKDDVNKPKTVDDIVNEYRKFHHATGKAFNERVAKFEEFWNPDAKHIQKFAHHADYVVNGHPSDKEKFPGAYQKAHQTLFKHLKNDEDILKDEDKLAEVMETYVDSFLEHAVNGYKDRISHAESEGATKEEIRALKDQLMSKYHVGKDGRPIPILDPRAIKELASREMTRLDLVDHLKQMGERTKNRYVQVLMSDSYSGLLGEGDELDMAKYLAPKLTDAGLESHDSLATKSIHELVDHYSKLVRGNKEELRQIGYKTLKKKEEK